MPRHSLHIGTPVFLLRSGPVAVLNAVPTDVRRPGTDAGNRARNADSGKSKLRCGTPRSSKPKTPSPAQPYCKRFLRKNQGFRDSISESVLGPTYLSQKKSRVHRDHRSLAHSTANLSGRRARQRARAVPPAGEGTLTVITPQGFMYAIVRYLGFGY